MGFYIEILDSSGETINVTDLNEATEALNRDGERNLSNENGDISK